METFSAGVQEFEPEMELELDQLDSAEDLSAGETERKAPDPSENSAATETASAEHDHKNDDPSPEPDEKAPAPDARNREIDYSVPQGRLDDAASQLDDLEKRRDELAARYENQEIDFREYDKAQRALAREEGALLVEKTKAAVYEDMQRQREAADWKSATAAFLADEANAPFKSPSMQGMLAQEVQAIFAQKSELSNAEVLAQAKRSVQAQLRGLLGLVEHSKTPEPERKKPAEKSALETTEIPPALSSIPAARSNATGDEFSHLDSLNGFDAERAASKMTPAQLERWLNA